VGSTLVNELPVGMIKKILKFYELNERRIKLIEDETAARMVSATPLVLISHWLQYVLNLLFHAT
jgi:hypothetical protein